MSGLTAFCEARISEDKARAHAMGHFTVHEEPYFSCPASRAGPSGDLEWGEEHCDCFLAERKARALREVEAKRAILAEYKRLRDAYAAFRHGANQAGLLGIETAAVAVAAIFSTHPDYQEGWKP